MIIARFFFRRHDSLFEFCRLLARRHAHESASRHALHTSTHVRHAAMLKSVAPRRVLFIRLLLRYMILHCRFRASMPPLLLRICHATFIHAAAVALILCCYVFSRLLLSFFTPCRSRFTFFSVRFSLLPSLMPCCRRRGVHTLRFEFTAMPSNPHVHISYYSPASLCLFPSPLPACSALPPTRHLRFLPACFFFFFFFFFFRYADYFFFLLMTLFYDAASPP